MTTTQDLVETASRRGVRPIMSIAEWEQRQTAVTEFCRSQLIPGSDMLVLENEKGRGGEKITKRRLNQPGAQKLAELFGLSTRIGSIVTDYDWTGERHGAPLFYTRYRIECWSDGLFVADAEGSCNSWEDGARYRWVNETDVPSDLDRSTLQTRGGVVRERVWIYRKRTTTGQYGKSEEYWAAIDSAIEAGTAKKVMVPKLRDDGEEEAWEIDVTQYRVPNESAAALINAVEKKAYGRALIAAVILATRTADQFASEWDEAPAPVAAGPIVPPEPQRTRKEIADAIGALRQAASPKQRSRMEAVRSAIMGCREPKTWTLGEVDALHRACVQITETDEADPETDVQLTDAPGAVTRGAVDAADPKDAVDVTPGQLIWKPHDPPPPTKDPFADADATTPAGAPSASFTGSTPSFSAVREKYAGLKIDPDDDPFADT